MNNTNVNGTSKNGKNNYLKSKYSIKKPIEKIVSLAS